MLLFFGNHWRTQGTEEQFLILLNISAIFKEDKEQRNNFEKKMKIVPLFRVFFQNFNKTYKKWRLFLCSACSSKTLIIIIKQHLSTLFEKLPQSAPCKGRNAAKPFSQRQRKVTSMHAECDRQQARADPLLFSIRPATLTCPGIALLVHGTTPLRDYPNHGMSFTHVMSARLGHNEWGRDQ